MQYALKHTFPDLRNSYIYNRRHAVCTSFKTYDCVHSSRVQNSLHGRVYLHSAILSLIFDCTAQKSSSFIFEFDYRYWRSKRVAQLSQTDQNAGRDRYGQKWKTGTER